MRISYACVVIIWGTFCKLMLYGSARGFADIVNWGFGYRVGRGMESMLTHSIRVACNEKGLVCVYVTMRVLFCLCQGGCRQFFSLFFHVLLDKIAQGKWSYLFSNKKLSARIFCTRINRIQINNYLVLQTFSRVTWILCKAQSHTEQSMYKNLRCSGCTLFVKGFCSTWSP